MNCMISHNMIKMLCVTWFKFENTSVSCFHLNNSAFLFIANFAGCWRTSCQSSKTGSSLKSRMVSCNHLSCSQPLLGWLIVTTLYILLPHLLLLLLLLLVLLLLLLLLLLFLCPHLPLFLPLPLALPLRLLLLLLLSLLLHKHLWSINNLNTFSPWVQEHLPQSWTFCESGGTVGQVNMSRQKMRLWLFSAEVLTLSSQLQTGYVLHQLSSSSAVSTDYPIRSSCETSSLAQTCK